MRDESVYRIARAWASIDGKLEKFIACEEDRNVDKKHGYYQGYMEDAKELVRRANVSITPLHDTTNSARGDS